MRSLTFSIYVRPFGPFFWLIASKNDDELKLRKVTTVPFLQVIPRLSWRASVFCRTAVGVEAWIGLALFSSGINFD